MRNQRIVPCIWLDNQAEQAHVAGRVSTNHSESTLYMAKTGLGIAQLADWLVEDDLQSGALVLLLPDYQSLRAPIRALTPPGNWVAPTVRALIDYLRAELSPRLADRGQ